MGSSHQEYAFEKMKTEKDQNEKVALRRKRWRAIAINSMAVVGALALFALLGFVGKSQSENRCHSVEVKLKNPNGHDFVSEKQILKSVYGSTDSIQGKLVKDIDLTQIHAAVVKNGAVREAHVYTTIDGRLRIDVDQRTPIARILNQSGTGFYLDEQGFTMPLSDLYSADVPLFTGNISESMMQSSVLEMTGDTAFCERSFLDDIYRITNYISKNEFWSAQIEHFYVNSLGEFVMVPRVGDHRIVIGNTENLDNKFRKLMAFYVDVMPVKNLNNVKTINLKYKGQVVCDQ